MAVYLGKVPLQLGAPADYRSGSNKPVSAWTMHQGNLDEELPQAEILTPGIRFHPQLSARRIFQTRTFQPLKGKGTTTSHPG